MNIKVIFFAASAIAALFNGVNVLNDYSLYGALGWFICVGYFVEIAFKSLD